MEICGAKARRIEAINQKARCATEHGKRNESSFCVLSWQVCKTDSDGALVLRKVKDVGVKKAHQTMEEQNGIIEQIVKSSTVRADDSLLPLLVLLMLLLLRPLLLLLVLLLLLLPLVLMLWWCSTGAAATSVLLLLMLLLPHCLCLALPAGGLPQLLPR